MFCLGRYCFALSRGPASTMSATPIHIGPSIPMLKSVLRKSKARKFSRTYGECCSLLGCPLSVRQQPAQLPLEHMQRHPAEVRNNLRIRRRSLDEERNALGVALATCGWLVAFR